MESRFLNPSKAVSLAQIHEGLHVADLGAGSAFFTRAAARAVGPGGAVWAVDVHRDILPRIKNLCEAEGYTNVHVVHGDTEVVGGTHLPAHSLDFVIAANLLFSIEHKHEFAGEVKRILKVGGKALIIDWLNSFGGLGPHKDHIVTEAQARALFEAHGFVYVDRVPAGEYHWGFVVRKKAA